MSKKTTLAEIMGKKASDRGTNLTLSHLPEILGDAMPMLPKTAVGRHRLVRALNQRFGPNFRSLPGIQNLMKEFDEDMRFERDLARMKQIKAGGRRG